MKSWDFRTFDADDVIIIKLCLKLKLLSIEQLQDIISKSVGQQFIFALSSSGLIDKDKMIELLQLKENSLLCPKCEALNEKSEQCFCCECGAFISQKRTTVSRARYGKYKVVEKIGEGGVGVVYKAKQIDLGRLVALKVLKAEGISKNVILRFQQEAKSVALLNHPNIVCIYDIGEDCGQHFIAMEYVSGSQLTSYIEKKSLTQEEILKIAIGVANGLEHAHKNQIIHRDIKPDNIILDIQKRAKIADFGLARQLNHHSRITQDNVIMGTPVYMAPEQAQGNADIDHAADIYSLGVVLYEMLSGHLPFGEKDESTLMLLQQIVSTPPPPLSQVNPRVPKELESICKKALEKKKEDRFKNAGEFCTELEKFLSHQNSILVTQALAKHGNSMDETEPFLPKHKEKKIDKIQTQKVPEEKKSFGQMLLESEEQSSIQPIDLILMFALFLGLIYLVYVLLQKYQ